MALPSFLPTFQYFNIYKYFLFLLFSSPDGSSDFVTSISVSEPAMRLAPVYVDGQTGG